MHRNDPLPIEIPRPSARRSIGALGASLLVHVLIVSLAVAGAGTGADPEEQQPSSRRVEIIQLPPLPQPAPDRPLPRVAPEPRRRVPRPQIVRGEPMPEEVTVRAERPPEPAPDLPLATTPRRPASNPEPPAPEPVDLASARAAEMQSEATRLFGPRMLGSDRPPGPISAQWVNELTDDRENDCTPVARTPRDPSLPPELGVVTGRVYRAGTRQPLPGAYLQILGTPYATFADDEGDYALEFDRSLVDDCRTQYVQVSKDGFAPQRLILSLGSRRSNDIPMQRR